jgi:hypothetical protein
MIQVPYQQYLFWSVLPQIPILATTAHYPQSPCKEASPASSPLFQRTNPRQSALQKRTLYAEVSPPTL